MKKGCFSQMISNNYPGDFLKEQRKKNGQTQNELAEICNISRSTLIRIENGDTVPNHQLIEKLSSELKIPYGKLLNIYASYYRELPKSSNRILEHIKDSEFNAFEVIEKWEEEYEEKKESEFDSHKLFINGMIIKNDIDYNEFTRNYSVIKKYRDGRPIIERFQFVVFLLTQIFDKNPELEYKIEKAHSVVNDPYTINILKEWFNKKGDSKQNFSILKNQVIETLDQVDKKYADLIAYFFESSIKHYALASKLSHAYDLVYPDIAKIEKIAKANYELFEFLVERMYVSSDFILNALNGVRTYEITDGTKIAKHLKYAEADDLYDFL